MKAKRLFRWEVPALIALGVALLFGGIFIGDNTPGQTRFVASPAFAAGPGYLPAKTVIRYEHPNFGTAASRIELENQGIFPQVTEFLQTGAACASVQEMPKDSGGWTTRKHVSGLCDALVLNSDGYQCAFGDGPPVCTHNGNPWP